MLVGTWPYALDNKKFEGSNAESNLLLPSLFPKPILSGLGSTSSSTISPDPPPKCISNTPFVLNLVLNLLGTFFSLKR